VGAQAEKSIKKTWNKPSNRSFNKETAYLPWTVDDDELLTNLVHIEMHTGEIAVQLGRTRGAIEARIKRLKLRDRDEY
jgi:hypothetical protein